MTIKRFSVLHLKNYPFNKVISNSKTKKTGFITIKRLTNCFLNDKYCTYIIYYIQYIYPVGLRFKITVKYFKTKYLLRTNFIYLNLGKDN